MDARPLHLAILIFIFLASIAVFKPTIIGLMTLMNPPAPPDDVTTTTTAYPLPPGPPGSVATTVTVSRELPSQTTAGAGLEVTLLVVKGDNPPNAVTINEYIPAGWNAAGSSLAYTTHNTETGEIKWLLFSSGFYTRNISYSITVPENASGTWEITGQYTYLDPDTESGVTADIDGDVSVDIASGLPADENSDGKVTLDEIVNAINQWASGEIDSSDLLDIINEWINSG